MLLPGSCGSDGGAAIAESRAEVCRCRTTTTTPTISSSATRSSFSHTQPSYDASFAFTLVSADDVSFHCCVTAYMCAHSLYLRSARDVGASEGSVPVGSAQAVRDYIAYLQYSDLRKQLAAELARPTAATGATATGAPLPPVASLVGVPPPEHDLRGDGARKVCDTAQSWLFPWDEDEIGRDGAHGYAAQPLDCDRAYTLHANRLRHWLTAAELASFRGETALEDAALARTGGGRRGRSPMAAAASPVPATTSASMLPLFTADLPLEPPPTAVTSADAQESAHHPTHSPQSFIATSSSSSSASSTSLTSSVSTASLEAYESAARATSGVDGGPHDRRQRTYLGEELGYGEFVALGDPEGLFFIEHVLLAHETTQGATAASTAGARWASDNSDKVTGDREQGLTSQNSQGVRSAPEASRKTAASTAAASAAPLPSHADPIVTLTARQQCRLLELISVADFMGTQSLVELCATYLAAWLMNRTDEEIVQSFLTTAGPSSAAAGAGASSAPTSFKVTGAASFNELWIAPLLGDDVAPGKSGEATNMPLPSAGVTATSGVVKPRMEAATAAAVTKRNAAMPKRAGKLKGNHAGSTDATAAGPLKYAGGDRGPTTASAAVEPAHAPLLLTDDQRLVLLRQMKRNNSIIVSPY
ncbi:hypothetical protein, conserved [Leishmania donovani]|uniref:Uncharacterized protein n=1 Tax=Leishmania donovani TaxID=5661 RepID=E9BQE1_LEIDO|nr:hypothetical protein, conserved [Leishmania donovani]CBZ37354.1 hypothetical protein, conserved [Leishmania donovani]